MSIRREISITCPECQKEHPFIMWESINTAIDPKMRSAVKDRSAFLFTCPTCGTKNYIDYGFLYHQMEDQIDGRVSQGKLSDQDCPFSE